jgi:hypothetical protein
MFVVTFRSQHIDQYVIRFSSPDGLRALDEARATFGPEIEYVTHPFVDFCRFEVCCDVTDEQARRAFFASGAFGESRQVTITVPPEALTKYVGVEYKLWGETAADCDYSVDARQLVEDWLAAGAPLKWEPPGTTGTEEDNQ